MMQIRTTAFGGAYIDTMLRMAPESLLTGVRSWLFRERNSFVGSHKGDGAFRKKIMRMRQAGGRGGTWPQNVARNFRGTVDGANKIQGMSLKMGVGGQTPFTEGLAKMEEGYSTSSGNMMIIPIYQTLMRRFVFTRYLSAFKKFKEMMSLNLLTMIEFGGRMYFFDRDGRKEPLFVGAKNITVKKQFGFTEDWNSRIPAVLDRGQKSIDKEIDKLAKA